MKIKVLLLFSIAVAAVPAALVTTANTGVNPGVEGGADSSWIVLETSAAAYTTAGYSAGLFPFDHYWLLANDSTSRWISPQPSYLPGGDAPGNWTFQTTFNLSGYLPNTAALTFRFAADDWVVDVLVNGESTRPLYTYGTASMTSFSQYYVLDNSRGIGFQSGINTLQFIVGNAFFHEEINCNPVSLRVEWSMTADSVVIGDPLILSPEPAAIVTVGAGLAVAVARRRRRTGVINR